MARRPGPTPRSPHRPLARLGTLGVLALHVAVAGAAPLAAQQAQPLRTTALAGQRVAVVPLTLVAIPPALRTDSLWAAAAARLADRRAALDWADSAIGAELEARGPEVTWVLPPELRRIARRSPGVVRDPDEMGQAVLRARQREVPDPLRSSLRSLVAMVGGRYALVPAALGFGREDDGRVRADLALALADPRSGAVLWQTLAVGRGGSPDEALGAALGAVLPAVGP
jgi:hypothetical protein